MVTLVVLLARVVLIAPLLVVLTAACADFNSPADPTGGVPDVLIAAPLFSRDIEPILVKRCAIGGCHTPGALQGGLTLSAGEAYNALVNIPSRLDSRFRRVVPFAPDTSWILRMLGPDSVGRGGRVRMPLASTPLTQNQLTTIRNWIALGAVRN
jgi:hypothetical protein